MTVAPGQFVYNVTIPCENIPEFKRGNLAYDALPHSSPACEPGHQVLTSKGGSGTVGLRDRTRPLHGTVVIDLFAGFVPSGPLRLWVLHIPHLVVRRGKGGQLWFMAPSTFVDNSGKTAANPATILPVPVSDASLTEACGSSFPGVIRKRAGGITGGLTAKHVLDHFGKVPFRDLLSRAAVRQSLYLQTVLTGACAAMHGMAGFLTPALLSSLSATDLDAVMKQLAGDPRDLLGGPAAFLFKSTCPKLRVSEESMAEAARVAAVRATAPSSRTAAREGGEWETASLVAGLVGLQAQLEGTGEAAPAPGVADTQRPLVRWPERHGGDVPLGVAVAVPWMQLAVEIVSAVKGYQRQTGCTQVSLGHVIDRRFCKTTPGMRRFQSPLSVCSDMLCQALWYLFSIGELVPLGCVTGSGAVQFGPSGAWGAPGADLSWSRCTKFMGDPKAIPFTRPDLLEQGLKISRHLVGLAAAFREGGWGAPGVLARARDIVQEVAVAPGTPGAQPLSEEQVDALVLLATSPLGVLQGGPGTGKTACVLSLVRALHLLHKKPKGGSGRSSEPASKPARAPLKRPRDDDREEEEPRTAEGEAATPEELPPRRGRVKLEHGGWDDGSGAGGGAGGGGGSSAPPSVRREATKEEEQEDEGGKADDVAHGSSVSADTMIMLGTCAPSGVLILAPTTAAVENVTGLLEGLSGVALTIHSFIAKCFALLTQHKRGGRGKVPGAPSSHESFKSPLGHVHTVLIEEASMVDTALFGVLVSLLRTRRLLPALVRMVLVGDTNQFMPISQGCAMMSVVQAVPRAVATLKRVWRFPLAISMAAACVKDRDVAGLARFVRKFSDGATALKDAHSMEGVVFAAFSASPKKAATEGDGGSSTPAPVSRATFSSNARICEAVLSILEALGTMPDGSGGVVGAADYSPFTTLVTTFTNSLSHDLGTAITAWATHRAGAPAATVAAIRASELGRAPALVPGVCYTLGIPCPGNGTANGTVVYLVGGEVQRWTPRTLSSLREEVPGVKGGTVPPEGASPLPLPKYGHPEVLILRVQFARALRNQMRGGPPAPVRVLIVGVPGTKATDRVSVRFTLNPEHFTFAASRTTTKSQSMQAPLSIVVKDFSPTEDSRSLYVGLTRAQCTAVVLFPEKEPRAFHLSEEGPLGWCVAQGPSERTEVMGPILRACLQASLAGRPEPSLSIQFPPYQEYQRLVEEQARNAAHAKAFEAFEEARKARLRDRFARVKPGAATELGTSAGAGSGASVAVGVGTSTHSRDSTEENIGGSSNMSAPALAPAPPSVPTPAPVSVPVPVPAPVPTPVPAKRQPPDGVTIPPRRGLQGSTDVAADDDMDIYDDVSDPGEWIDDWE